MARAVLLSIVCALIAAAAVAAKPTPTITLVGAHPLRYGDSFTASYTGKLKDAFAYAVCYANASTVVGTPNQGTYAPGDPVWSGYRSLTGRTGDTFVLTDPIQGLWVGGGADCRLDLIDLPKPDVVLASVPFTVYP